MTSIPDLRTDRLTARVASGDRELSRLRDIVDTAYLIVLSDQWESGLWARSLQVQSETLYRDQAKQRKAADAKGRFQSVTDTWLAVQALLAYTGRPDEGAIQLTLRGLEGAHSPGIGYSTLQEDTAIHHPGLLPKPKRSARHTAGAGLVMLASGASIQAVREAARDLLTPGFYLTWGAGGDPNGREDHEVLTLALALEFLSRFQGQVGGLSDSEAKELRSATEHALRWLAAYLRDFEWWRIEGGRGPIDDTLWVVSLFPALKRLDPPTYETAMEKIRSARCDGRPEWPVAKVGAIQDLGATIWGLRALLMNGAESDVEAAIRGISFVNRESESKSTLMALDTSHWSSLLYLGAELGLKPDTRRKAWINRKARNLQGRMATHPRGFFGVVRLPRYLRMAKEPLRRILAGEGYSGEDRLALLVKLRRLRHSIPEEALWVALAIGFVVSLVTGILFIAGYLHV